MRWASSKACPEIDKVVVVENNSRDRTYEVALTRALTLS